MKASNGWSIKPGAIMMFLLLFRTVYIARNSLSGVIGVPVLFSVCSAWRVMFPLEPMSGVRIQTMAFPHWLLQGHWRDPSCQLRHFPRESGLGVLLGSGHGEGEPRFPLHLQWQDHKPCLGVVRFLAATDKIAYIILVYWFLICCFCLLQNVYLHR